jgi:hypothetical protein|tara:strand:+ start:845 stop:1192 length:348 start_codon:yes stop_codon:yes gene_type:complete
MNDILLELLYSILGGFILSNISIIIFQIVSFHPYSRPTIPVFIQSLSVLFCLAIIIQLNDGITNFSNSMRFGLTEGIVDILTILPIFYVLMLYFLFRASIRSLPEDPLLALLDSE